MATKQIRLKNQAGDTLHPETEVARVNGLSDALAVKAAASDLTAHTGNKNNPHGVTKSQVGLGNVDNTADSAKPVSTAQQSAIDTAKSTAISTAGTNADSKISAHNGSSTAHSDIRTAVSKAQSKANDAYSLAEGRSRSMSYDTYSEMVTALLSLSVVELRVGDNIYIGTLDVPDIWVSKVNATSSQYSYQNDTVLASALKSSTGVTIGYYTLKALETNKVDLTGYATASADLTADKIILGAGSKGVKSSDIGIETVLTPSPDYVPTSSAVNTAIYGACDSYADDIKKGTILAKKAECDSEGNKISTTYQKLSDSIFYEEIQ